VAQSASGYAPCIAETENADRVTHPQFSSTGIIEVIQGRAKLLCKTKK
jgi:hypothetical protein